MWFITTKLFSLTLLWFVHNTVDSKSSGPSPVVIIPGTGGSRAQIDLFTGGNPVHLWVSYNNMFRISTVKQYFGLTYDSKTHRTMGSNKGKVSFPGWGDTWTIEHLGWFSNTHLKSATKQFAQLVEGLVENPFYVRGKTVRGAPYDFRRAPNEADDFFRRLKRLIEETYENAEGRRVMLVAHSMGGLYSQFFLKNVTATWRKKYIRGLMTVGTPFAGSVRSLKAELHGHMSKIYKIRPFQRQYRSLLRSWPSTAFLLPNAKYWSDKEPLVITPKRIYTTKDYEQLFRDINFPTGYLMRNDTEHLLDPDTDIPQVDELYCVHSKGKKTEKRLVYKEPFWIFRQPFPEQSPTIEYGDGDGTVNIRSLSVCKKWPGVTYKVFMGQNHVGLLRDATFVEYVKDILNRGD